VTVVEPSDDEPSDDDPSDDDPLDDGTDRDDDQPSSVEFSDSRVLAEVCEFALVVLDACASLQAIAPPSDSIVTTLAPATIRRVRCARGLRRGVSTQGSWVGDGAVSGFDLDRRYGPRVRLR
jgi:hypothetical protein